MKKNLRTKMIFKYVTMFFMNFLMIKALELIFGRKRLKLTARLFLDEYIN